MVFDNYNPDTIEQRRLLHLNGILLEITEGFYRYIEKLPEEQQQTKIELVKKRIDSLEMPDNDKKRMCGILMDEIPVKNVTLTDVATIFFVLNQTFEIKVKKSILQERYTKE